MDFIHLWGLLFAMQLLMMAIDNLFWIFRLPVPASIENFIKRLTGHDAYAGTYIFSDFMKLPLKEKIRFAVFERFVQVLINPVDISACLTGSFMFAYTLKSLGVF